MTSPTGSGRPEPADQAALYDAVAAEHAAIYGYGMVSAHSLPSRNGLVSDAMAQHRELRETALAMLAERNVEGPLPAAGYQLPMPVGSPRRNARLAAPSALPRSVSPNRTTSESVSAS